MKQTSSIPIVHGYKPYQQVRRAVFSVPCESNLYELPGGWKQKLVEYTIIGETATSYVEYLRLCNTRFNGNGKPFLLPMGVHKTRLVKWLTGQLELF